MEGLFIAEELAKIAELLPAKRISWRFPDTKTFVLPLLSHKKAAIWLYSRPPKPRLALENDFPETTNTLSGFQDLLVSKASGDLLRVEQIKLDRVVRFHFAAGQGFVPSPAVTLVFELTGRNCNIILLDQDDKILGAFRDISSDINRFRQVRSGLSYKPPPPYEKLDPREIGQSRLEQALTGKSLKSIRKTVDGIGPELSRALAIASKLSPTKALNKEDIVALYPLLNRLMVEPTRFLQETIQLKGIKDLRLDVQRLENKEKLKLIIEKELKLIEKRLADIQKIRLLALQANEIKQKADILMAFQQNVPKNASSVRLYDFEGREVEIKLDPKLSARQNAQNFYKRSQKAKRRKAEAEQRVTLLENKQKEFNDLLASLDEMDNRKLLEKLKKYQKVKVKNNKPKVGLHYTGPHGFSILVGKSSKENDLITRKIARSRDIWLHAQGYRGSHVIIQANNKEVPFDTILYAARLAAAYSKAGQSENVPVDYTFRKHVWFQKSAALGAVNYAHQKTIYVNPSRTPDAK